MKKYILGIITGVIGMLILGVSATILYNAKDIIFTPNQNDWNVSSVGEAIQDLYDKYEDLQKEFELQEKNFYFSYTGQYQEFTAPMNGVYKIELWGAQGGSVSSYTGGLGGYTSGNINLNKDEKLYIYVGQKGIANSPGTVVWNGGGYAGYNSDNQYYNGSGGGSTDVRLVSGSWNDFDSLKSRIMVAGAGGGSSIENKNTAWYSGGGAGGGLQGLTPSVISSSSSSHNGIGGTQTSGGYAKASINYAVGSFGKGGNSNSLSYGAGGGSGYYGGGGASNSSGGGGGSSYISGHEGCNAITGDSTSSNIIHTGSSLHYSKKFFVDTVIIDGLGYKWTTEKTTKVGMPSITGTSTEYGHSGDGYAKITLIGLN